eukprot:GHVS01014225.1.p1 GENE.GHVS01014225.1~~GHVS01014225.1.p1  ORF type:complete len:160 (+),score=7.19 GHVS01014225.1:71-481(+)
MSVHKYFFLEADGIEVGELFSDPSKLEKVRLPCKWRGVHQDSMPPSIMLLGFANYNGVKYGFLLKKICHKPNKGSLCNMWNTGDDAEISLDCGINLPLVDQEFEARHETAKCMLSGVGINFPNGCSDLVTVISYLA